MLKPPLFMMSNDFDKRYERQLLLPEVGRVGQRLLAEKRVVVVGAGGLGCTILPLLVGSGVGYVRVCDDDVVSLSNLPRQTLYTMAQIGQPKAVLAAEHLRANNPHCEVEVVCERLREENATQILDGCDLIIDATDNESTRRLLDRYARAHSTPWLYISVEGWQGQIALFDAQHPTYGDLFPIDDNEVTTVDQVDLCSAPIPVMSTTPALLGALAATEAIKYLLVLPTQLSDSLLLVDGLRLSFQRILR
jgi:probable molybdopterin biosynthesis moeB protein